MEEPQVEAGPGSQSAEVGNFQALKPSPPARSTRKGQNPPTASHFEHVPARLRPGPPRPPKEVGDTQVSSAKNSLHSAPHADRPGLGVPAAQLSVGVRALLPLTGSPVPLRGLSWAPALGFG